MIVFYDPASGNQVMAVYTHGTGSTVWEDRGYVRAAVPPSLVGEVRRKGRDARLVFDGEGVAGLEDSPNPVRPAPPPRTRLDDLRDKLAEDSITDAEIREMMRLERGL